MGHGTRHLIASRFRLASSNTNLDKLTRALTVAHNVLRQLNHQCRQRLREALGVFGACCDLNATLPRGRERDRIVGRGIAIDRDAIEARLIQRTSKAVHSKAALQ